jgi:predicted alpha/beta superfamily hydrolase
MQDGQNLFDAAMSFAGEWHVDTTMERLSHDGVEAIVVGVPNTGVTRAEEYSPFKDPKAGGGRGDDYLRFLVDTVMPLVNEGFRTRRERAHTGILGSSLGGLIGLYALLSRPDDFGFAGAMSPSLWFADRALLRYVEALDGWRGRVYLDTGTGEGRLQVRLAREAARALRRGATRPRLQLRYIEDRDAGHNETAWASRFERAIRWLLPRQRKELNW